MFKRIEFHAFLRMLRPAKVERLLHREMTLERCERYWKVPEYLDVRFSCAPNVEDPA